MHAGVSSHPPLSDVDMHPRRASWANKAWWMSEWRCWPRWPRCVEMVVGDDEVMVVMVVVLPLGSVFSVQCSVLDRTVLYT